MTCVCVLLIICSKLSGVQRMPGIIIRSSVAMRIDQFKTGCMQAMLHIVQGSIH